MTLNDRGSYIINAKVVGENGTIRPGTLEIRNGVIRRIGRADDPALRPNEADDVYNAEGDWILPGFIDIHVHGGNGRDFMSGEPEAVKQAARFHARHGTTGMLVTTYSESRERLHRVLDASSELQAAEERTYAQVLGVHLEGPFLNPAWAGAHNLDHIVPPRLDWLEAWAHRYPGLIRIVTLAPEMPGAMEAIDWLKREGIVSACGHTGATYDQIMAAAANGMDHAVHTYNAMVGLHHRQPGALGAVLTSPGISAEIIADGQHVHPACIRLLLQAKPDDKVILVTDAIAAAGYPDGEFDVGGLPIRVKDGIARVKGSDTLAGSTLTMIQAFRYAVHTLGVSVEAASRMASGNPAKRLGLHDRIGSIAAGKDADLLRLDSQLRLRQVFVKGVPLE